MRSLIKMQMDSHNNPTGWIATICGLFTATLNHFWNFVEINFGFAVPELITKVFTAGAVGFSGAVAGVVGKIFISHLRKKFPAAWEFVKNLFKSKT